MAEMTKKEALTYEAARRDQGYFDSGIDACLANAEDVFPEAMQGDYRRAWASMRSKFPGAKRYGTYDNNNCYYETNGIDCKLAYDAYMRWRNKHPEHDPYSEYEPNP